MNKQMIKVVNPVLADKLVKIGFSIFAVERINNGTCYVFPSSEELLSYLHSNFSNSDYVVADRLVF